MSKEQNELAETEVETAEVTEETVEAHDPTPVLSDEQKEDMLAQALEEADAVSKEIYGILKEKPLTVIVETFAILLNVIGEETNVGKNKLLAGIQSVMNDRYPEQHPLIKIVTSTTGKNAAVNVEKDVLYIVENGLSDTVETDEGTVLNLVTMEWERNDYDLEEAVLNEILEFYKLEYPLVKQQIEAQKAAQEMSMPPVPTEDTTEDTDTQEDASVPTEDNAEEHN